MDGLTVQVNVTGEQVFGTNGSNVFDVLTDIVDSLRNDPSALNANLEALDERAVAFRSAHAQVGARYNQVDRKSVVQGKSVSVRVDLGGRRNIKNKIHKRLHNV